jgi:hypothetical protein
MDSNLDKLCYSASIATELMEVALDAQAAVEAVMENKSDSFNNYPTSLLSLATVAADKADEVLEALGEMQMEVVKQLEYFEEAADWARTVVALEESRT